MTTTNLEAGQIVRVRSRQYLVEEVEPKPSATDAMLVRLSCLEDDAQGEPLEVLWELEVDSKVIGTSSWEAVAKHGFDAPNLFSAYLNCLRWNCVTSTDPKLFQAPYRAGIQIKAYQLEPLRMALQMPRVNLFIGDDVGVGKTIEAGLIVREMIMRQKVRRVVISCPPSVVLQWQEEMESRFGLTFVVYDRDFVKDRRRERGYGINPWTTHNRFIISHALLRDENYAGPMRDWLGDFSPGSLLILDECHNAAPASGAKYAVDSKLTNTVRDVSKIFEHKIFMSATPHNGHSNSFAALLEILDPQRFCRGVPVTSKKLLEAVMVRRLKEDLREFEDDFPERKIIPIICDGLSDDAPELRLSQLLQEYRTARDKRIKDEPKSIRNASGLVMISLQKRLLSSVEAFARTLKVHSTPIEKRAFISTAPSKDDDFSLLKESTGSDDDRAELDEAEVEAEEDAQTTKASLLGLPADKSKMAKEICLLREMADIANRHRHQPDPRIDKLVAWIKANQCPGLDPDGDSDGAKWNDRRVLIFTEYTDTKRYLVQQLESAIAGTERASERIATFHGGMGDASREKIKKAFNAHPSKQPLRILIATDAAREGVNLQNYCSNLFHFDVPWNPSRLEQRNGRIDRKLQREKEVHCHYFVFPQRAEDRVIDVLVRKTRTIQEELGTLSPVIDRKLTDLLDNGITHDQASLLQQTIEQIKPSSFEGTKRITDELEVIRKRKEKLDGQLTELRGLLDTSKDWLGLKDDAFRNAISASLEILKAPALTPMNAAEAAKSPDTASWELPALDKRAGADPTWAATLDTLRVPKTKEERLDEWRRTASIRPIVFTDTGTLNDDVVHLHLEHRVVQRLLGRFLAQGFVHNDLTRACVCKTDDPIPRVIVLGRLSLYGDKAARLHDEVLASVAEWVPPNTRKGKLKPLGEGDKAEALGLVDVSLATPRLQKVSDALRSKFKDSAVRDIDELTPSLKKRANILIERAKKALANRGEAEAKDMKELLIEQRKRIKQELAKRKNVLDDPQQKFGFAKEKRQYESDVRHMKRKLESIADEIESEPARIRTGYEVKATRVEPVGIVYLWPVSG